ncbi:MAG TPA: histidine kinase [Streptosporangiaceae bacterium]|nr:histidine kinase [Streptosporangiaceae bacterium]
MGRVRDALGIRLIDAGAFLAVLAAVEITVATGGGPGAHPLNTVAYVAGGVLVLPVLLRHKWPLQVLIACSVLLLFYYWFARRNIPPTPLLSLPLYDAAVAGYLAVAIVIPVFYMSVGLFVVDASMHESLVSLASSFLLPVVVLALAIVLGDTVRSRRALAAETADRLRLAAEEREAEAAARVAQERLRIARELHDTVAHGMATITVQAGSALHLLGEDRPGLAAAGNGAAGPPAAIRDALVAIRDTGKAALTDMRATLGQLRGGGADVDGAETRTAGLDRLDSLSEAVRAAGAPVSVAIEGQRVPLPPGVDHAAYRILQESLTNVLRHAGPEASAAVCLRYEPGALTIRVTDDGDGGGAGRDGASGHGLTGMTERAAAVGGRLEAGPRPGGGFEVTARLPVSAALSGPPS